MVLWYVTAGADWDDVGRLSQGWGNAQEIALARQFVAGLEKTEGRSPTVPGRSGTALLGHQGGGRPVLQLADGLRVLWGKYPVLGLTAKEGVPASPDGPALACRLDVSDTAVVVKLTASHPSGSDWIVLGSSRSSRSNPEMEPGDAATGTPTSVRERDAARLGDAVAERLLARLVRLTSRAGRGSRVRSRSGSRSSTSRR